MMLNHDTPDDYVVATGEKHSVREFAKIAFEHVGLNWEDHVEVDPKFLRPAEVTTLCGDCSKAKRILGWTAGSIVPRVGADDGGCRSQSRPEGNRVRALITGITGFAGQYLAEHLVDCGDEVVGSTYLDPWSRDVAEAVRRKCPVVRVESDRADSRRRARAGASGWRSTGFSTWRPSACPANVAARNRRRWPRRSMSTGRARCWRWPRRSSPRPRVLVISSSHVYAPVSADHPRVAEDAPLGPTGAYGITKLRCEELCREAVEPWSGCDCRAGLSACRTPPARQVHVARVGRAVRATGPRPDPRRHARQPQRPERCARCCPRLSRAAGAPEHPGDL